MSHQNTQKESLLSLIKHETYKDHRGSYTPISLSTLATKWDQCSISVNDKRFTFRGMHYQTAPPQLKYIKVIKGEILDFAYDLNSGLLSWAKVGSDEAVLIPEDKAHGFLTLQENTIVAYLVKGEWIPESEHSIVWSKIPKLKSIILGEIEGHQLTISEKDSKGK